MLTLFNQYLLSAAPSDKLKKCWVYAAFIILALYVLVLPISGTIAARNILLFLLIGITACQVWHKNIKLAMPVICPWIAYAIVALISLTYAIDVHYSFKEIRIEILYGIAIMVLAATWLNNRKALMGLISVLIIGNVFLLLADLYAAVETKNIWPVLQAAPFKIGVGKFSTYILMVLPFIAAYILQLKNRTHVIMGIALLIANIVALYLTTNRIAFICLMGQIFFAAFLLGIIKKKKKIDRLFYLIAILLILIVVDLIMKRGPGDITLSQQLETDARWHLWSLAIKDIFQHPFAGGGFGIYAFKFLHPEISQANGLLWHAHNVVLNIGVQMGIPGILAFLYLIGSVLYKLFNYLRNTDTFIYYFALAGIASLVGLMLKIQTDDFFNRDIALLFWLLTGALLQTLKGSTLQNASTSTEIRN